MTLTDTHLYGDGQRDRLVTAGDPSTPDLITVGDVERAFAELRVSKEPLYRMAVTPDGVGPEEIPDRRSIERTDNGRVLNVVRPGYTVHQYEDVLLNPARQLVQAGDGDVTIQAYGHAKWGGTAWVNLALREPVTIHPTHGPDGGPDVVFSSVFLSSSHDGTWSTGARLGNYRMFCRNQLRSFHRRGTTRWGHGLRVRHTSGSTPRLEGLDQILAAITAEREALQVVADDLLRVTLSDAQVADVLDLVDPRPQAGVDGEPVTARRQTAWERRRAAMGAYYRGDEAVVPYVGTGWGLYQALNGFAQHGTRARGCRETRTALQAIGGGLHDSDGAVLTAIAKVTDAASLAPWN